MRTLIAIILIIFPSLAWAANPSMTDFYGTNGARAAATGTGGNQRVAIGFNAGGNFLPNAAGALFNDGSGITSWVTIIGTNLIAFNAADFFTNGANVVNLVNRSIWTNDDGNVYTLPTDATNLFTKKILSIIGSDASTNAYTDSGVNLLRNGVPIGGSITFGTNNLNPTIGFLPYKQSGTNFGDSPLLRLSDTSLGFAGSTNVLTRSVSDLIYTNSSSGLVAFRIRNATGFNANLGVTSGGATTLFADAGKILVLSVSGGAAALNYSGESLFPTVSNAVHLGTVDLPFKDLFLTTNSFYLGTNKYADNGTDLLRNGVAVGGGGGPWTDDGTITYLDAGNTNVFRINDTNGNLSMGITPGAFSGQSATTLSSMKDFTIDGVVYNQLEISSQNGAGTNVATARLYASEFNTYSSLILDSYPGVGSVYSTVYVTSGDNGPEIRYDANGTDLMRLTNGFGYFSGELSLSGQSNRLGMASDQLTLDGIPIGDATLLVANSIFVATNGNNSTGARGYPGLPFADIYAANSNSFPGDVIIVGPGVFQCPNWICLSNRVSLVGSGMYTTTLSNLVTSGRTFMVPGRTGSTIADMKLTLGEFASLGVNYIDDQEAFTGATFRNLEIHGDVDGFLAYHTNTCSGTFYGCRFIGEGSWDVCAIYSDNPPLTTNLLTFSFFDCYWSSTGPSIAVPGQPARGLVCGGNSVINVYNGYIYGQSNSVWMGTDAPNLNLHNVSLDGGPIHRTTGDTLSFDAIQTPSGSVIAGGIASGAFVGDYFDSPASASDALVAASYTAGGDPNGKSIRLATFNDTDYGESHLITTLSSGYSEFLNSLDNSASFGVISGLPHATLTSTNVVVWEVNEFGNSIQTGTLTTGIPTGGSISTNKFGAKETGLTITANVTNAVRVEINGTKYWLMIANETPP